MKGDLLPLNDSLEGGKEALKALILRVASVDHLLNYGTERPFIFHQKLGRFHMIRRVTIGSQLGCFRKISILQCPWSVAIAMGNFVCGTPTLKGL